MIDIEPLLLYNQNLISIIFSDNNMNGQSSTCNWNVTIKEYDICIASLDKNWFKLKTEINVIVH